MRPYFPGGTLIALATPRKGSIPLTANVHRLRLGLPGYLILFAPLAFVPQCQESSRDSLSPPVFLSISTHFTVHREFQSPLRPSSKAVFNAVSELSSEISHQTCPATYAPFTPSESEQRLGPLYYRGCWHRVSRPFLFRYYQLLTYLVKRFVRK